MFIFKMLDVALLGDNPLESNTKINLSIVLTHFGSQTSAFLNRLI
jgi:hypothetical protein